MLHGFAHAADELGDAADGPPDRARRQATHLGDIAIEFGPVDAELGQLLDEQVVGDAVEEQLDGEDDDDEVGRDAVRFFLLSRRADTEFVFDVDLAKSQTEENPVYYVQYAHARICSVLEQWQTQFGDQDPEHTLEDAGLAPLTSARELGLLQRLGEFPEVLENAAGELAPHQVIFFLRELAGEFHSYYNAERILVPEAPARLARLALCCAVRQVLRNGLSLLGVSQPEKM